MSSEVSAAGCVTFTGAPDDILAELQAHHPAVASAGTLADAIVEMFNLDWVNEDVQGDSVTYSVDFYAKAGSWLGTAFDALAAVGGTGEVELVDAGGHGDRSMVVLAGGKARELTARTFYPGHPDPAEPVVALTRQQVLALLAFVAGERVDGLDDVVKVLADASAL